MGGLIRISPKGQRNKDLEIFVHHKGNWKADPVGGTVHNG
jgi:hypothetical protein